MDAALIMGDVSPLDIPNLTEDGLYVYLSIDMGIPLTRNVIKHAVISREILPTKIGKRNLFSRRDGLNWVAAHKETKA